MKTKYPVKTFTIVYAADLQVFRLKNDKGEVVATDPNGRELGRIAWDNGAEQVKYDYDLGIDENIPLKQRRF